MSDDMTKSTIMNRDGGEEVDQGGTSNSKDDNTALNLVRNGHCPACDKDVDVSVQGIKCWFCHEFFHAINCIEENLSVAAPSVFNNHLQAAAANTGVYERRFGRFLFACDYCITLEEEKRSAASTDRVELLDMKIEALNKNFMSELTDLKKLISCPKPPSMTQNVTPPSSSGSINPWNDEQKTDNLRHTMAVGKDNTGNPLNPEVIEKICVENGISVHKTFELSKSKSTGIVLNSKSDADRLTEKLKNEVPSHKIEKVSTRTPTITVVGLKREYTKEELTSMITRQNSGINTLMESTSASPEDKEINVVTIKPLKNNQSIFKAIIRVSNVIRSVISKQGDRLFIGFQATCKVYDSIYVLRCYKCQGFNHHSRDCKNDAKCGFCAGPHETRVCTVKENVNSICCINCTKAGKSGDDVAHEAGSQSCPIYIDHFNKVKSSIPFHQGS